MLINISFFVQGPKSKLVLDVNPDVTVLEIKDMIKDITNSPTCNQRLIYTGVTLDDKKKIGYYKITNGVTIHAVLRFLTRYFYESDDTFQIYVKTLTGKTITVPVKSGYTILQIKEMIQNLEGIPVGQGRLLWAGLELKDGKDIGEYNIQKEDTIHIVCRMRGGGIMFTDVTRNEDLKEIIFYAKAPKWRCISSGLNISGLCKNEACDAYNDNVTCPVGDNIFDLIKHEVLCPMCKNQVKPHNCNFMGCKWRYHGIKEATKEICISDWFKSPIDKYHTFDQKKEHNVEWESLLIETKLYGKEVGIMDDTFLCAICLDYHRDYEVSSLECKHRFHKTCILTWHKRSSKCPLCRANIKILDNKKRKREEKEENDFAPPKKSIKASKKDET